VPDAEYADMPFLFPDIKNNAVNSPAPAVKQMPDRKTKIVGLRYQRAAGRRLAEAVKLP
jgi:hypothetical protein